jgi:hypothetical protein
MQFTYKVRPVDAVTARFWEDTRQMTNREFASRTTKRTFETYNTIGLAQTELAIGKAEEEAGEFDPDYIERLGDAERAAMAENFPPEWIEEIAEQRQRHKFAMPEEEWKASEWFDPRITYVPHMTPTRARILKENRDRLDAEDRLLAHESDSWGRTALGFGAGMFAALPDPINLIPFGAGARAVSLGKAAKRGAQAGVATNLAADAVILPWAHSYGEEVGAKDLLMNAVFGAVLGGASALRAMGLRDSWGVIRAVGVLLPLLRQTALPRELPSMGAHGQRASLAKASVRKTPAAWTGRMNFWPRRSRMSRRWPAWAESCTGRTGSRPGCWWTRFCATLTRAGRWTCRPTRSGWAWMRRPISRTGCRWCGHRD